MCAGSWVNKSETHRLSEANTVCFPIRSSAVLSIGAATLADIFDPAVVRGKKVGRYQPLCFPHNWHCIEVGNFLHCIIAWTGVFLSYIKRNLWFIFALASWVGILTSTFNWRAIFWFPFYHLQPEPSLFWSCSSMTHSGTSEALVIKLWLDSNARRAALSSLKLKQP